MCPGRHAWPAWTGSRRPRLWICRFAWTTQTRCPHTHSRRKSSRKLLDFEGQGQTRLHLNSGDPWSHVRGPLQKSLSEVEYEGLLDAVRTAIAPSPEKDL